MCRPTCCISVILYFISVLFTFVLGIILGSAFAATFLPILTWLIVGAILLFIAAVAIAVSNVCRCCRSE